MTLDRLARFTSDTPLRDRQDEDIRKVILALGRISYEQGKLDAIRELESLIT